MPIVAEKEKTKQTEERIVFTTNLFTFLNSHNRTNKQTIEPKNQNESGLRFLCEQLIDWRFTVFSSVIPSREY